jgi:NAD(P)-dependent dehydrogenase (short-subunit alcohol dehydrogenase family)
MGRFAGRTVVVTGAASGIGAEMTRLFAAEGATVVGGDLRDEPVEGAARMIAVDVSDPEQVRQFFAQARELTGRIDVLCANAGIGSSKDVLAVDADEWDRVFAVNVRGVFLCVQNALPTMLEQRSGAIVTTGSVAGLIGLRDRAAYCASKAAVIGLTKQVAVQYAGTGVRCNSICPGTVDTPWVQRLLGEAADPDARLSELIARQPLGRLGTPTEVAQAALYLASDDAAFITGTGLVIDGGIVAA